MRMIHRYLKHLRIALLIAVVAVTALPTPVLAIADPDSPPQVSAVYVYDNLLEDGDVGVLIDYYLDYAVLPPTGETATESYIAIFIDTDGVTQLKSVAPYTFAENSNKGYRRGLVWIYFTPAEVVDHNIVRANIADYEIWLVGNPTLGWVPGPDPPKTIAGIDYWQPLSSNTAVLLALRVLNYAQVLEQAWAAPVIYLIMDTPPGPRLTFLGESYFTNVIQNLREMAPNAFASGEYAPVLEDLDYSTTFGATIRNGTAGTLPVSPLALSATYNNGTAIFTLGSPAVVGVGTAWNTTMAGASIQHTVDGLWHTILSVTDATHLTLTANYAGAGGAAAAYTMTNIVAITGTGTFVATLTKGTVGTADNIVGGAIVTGAPVPLVYGANTITVTLGGTNNFTVDANIVSTATTIEDTVIGTALDVTTLATLFGVSRLMLSGLIWLAVSIVICAGVYLGDERIGAMTGRGGSSGKTALLVFDICIIAGTLLGMLHIIAAVLLFIGYNALIGYVVFYRGANA